MYAMDFLLIKWSMDYAKVQNSESCNFLQIGDATFSIFVLQLSVFKLCNKQWTIFLIIIKLWGSQIDTDAKMARINILSGLVSRVWEDIYILQLGMSPVNGSVKMNCGKFQQEIS